MSIQLELPVAASPALRQVDVIRDLSDYGKPGCGNKERPASSATARERSPEPRSPQPHQLGEQEAKRDGLTLRKIAAHRIGRIALPREERHRRSAAQLVDHETSMADARIALCIADGIDLDDIDPASGYSLSRESYESVRQSWRDHAERHGWNECYRRDYEELLAYWSERRPEFTEDDDWLAGIEERRQFK